MSDSSMAGKRQPGDGRRMRVCHVDESGNMRLSEHFIVSLLD